MYRDGIYSVCVCVCVCLCVLVFIAQCHIVAHAAVRQLSGGGGGGGGRWSMGWVGGVEGVVQGNREQVERWRDNI